MSIKNSNIVWENPGVGLGALGEQSRIILDGIRKEQKIIVKLV
jgi:hypothetical protein